MVLNIMQDEYIESQGAEAGARVVVHDQTRVPFPEDEGSLARTGMLTSIGLQRVAS